MYELSSSRRRGGSGAAPLISEQELRKLPAAERDWILAWRNSQEEGEKYNRELLINKNKSNLTQPQGDINQDINSLDRQFAQLRQNETEAIKKERELKKYLKDKGILFGESLEGTKFYFAEEWDEIIEEYEKWRTNMENCYLILKTKDSDPSRQAQDRLFRDKGKKGIVAQCQTRFSQGKKKITRWRMEQFSEKMKCGGNRYGLEVTLTTDPKRFNNLKEVGEKWKFFLEKFNDFARTRLWRAKKKGVYCYLKGCELTDTGLLHVHIGFFGHGITGKILKKYANGKEVKDYIFPQKDVAKLWKKYGIGEIAWIAKKPVNECTDYITKHVAKNWGSYDGNQMLEAFLHATGMRQWTSSKGAVPKEPPALQKYELLAFAIGINEASTHRQDLIDEGYTLIQDDLLVLLNKQPG